MGLDMYLSKRTYVKSWNHTPPDERYLVKVTQGGKPVESINPELISEITEEVGYWRKVNQIHNWFVKNVQGGIDECQESYVSREQLQNLLDTVNEVLASPNKAEKLLPTSAGFFFGNTDYGEYYFEDLGHTKKILENILRAPWPLDASFYYHSSW